MNLKILGIDPAPGKKSLIYDGNSFQALGYQKLKRYIFSFKQPLLIAWDAPLGVDVEYSLTIKQIERELRKELKPPRGISILPFANCPHWTISQFLFGLPSIHPEHKPFATLITSFEQHIEEINLLEVHPALSMWLWLKDELPCMFNWRYKGIKSDLKSFLTIKQKLEEKVKVWDVSMSPAMLKYTTDAR
ncbi:hypothetical protein NitYY0826_C1185 [Nitratiruptor sp. YY08-26]|uniref:hypothetical protein n=1 Tax=unclassified Nitratiruptor TaxID=2624044 RepID=UPI0019161AEE|nr:MULTISPECIES: hypothetical protein [unclassified Nitratiruptor]BCD62309.1 hypothetical protein NitYY0813_C1183 [Nitratiruptor sp. YY08-13]BCD66245.1 hypothetical protein NitYY0826_C1185 [Nitratiruptor sp. YY08-26]